MCHVACATLEYPEGVEIAVVPTSPGSYKNDFR